MWKKKWFRWVSVLIVLGVAWGIYLYTKPVQKMSRLTPDYSLTADQLFNEFQEDEAVARENYVDKVIAVTGTVSEINQTEDQVISVRLQSSHPGFGVLCELESGEEVSELKEGDEVTMKGVCTGKLMDVVLFRCIEM